jgi:DNA polymerase (family 10)
MFQFTQIVELVPESGEPLAEQPAIRVSNPQVAEVLFNIATLLEMQQANPYRIAAYRNAARGVLALGEPITDILARGERLEVPGLGERLRKKIGELVTTGRMTFYDDLCEESLPEDVRALMAVPRVGPRTALRLTGQLDIHTVAQLHEAATGQRLRNYYGFGPRSEANLAAGARALLDAIAVAPPDTAQSAPSSDESHESDGAREVVISPAA